MSTEISELTKVIYSRLYADSQIQSLLSSRIYFGQVPQGSTTPWILYDQFGGTDFNGIGTVRIQTEIVMAVRVIKDAQPDANMRTIEARMDAVLQNLVRVVSGGWVFSSRREGAFSRNYLNEAGTRYTELGGFYRFYISTS